MRQMSSGCCGTGWMFSFLNFEKNLRINRCTVDVLEFDFEKKSGDASDYSECLALPHRGGPNDVFHGQEQMEHLGLDPTDPLPPPESMEDLVGFQWDFRGGFIHQDQSNASKKAIAAMSEDGGDMLHGTLSSHLVAQVACSHCSLFQELLQSVHGIPIAFLGLTSSYIHIFLQRTLQIHNHRMGSAIRSFIPNVNNME